MKILLVSTRMGIGGAETHILTLARALTARGHFVHILSSGGALVDSLTSSGILHTRLPLDKKSPAAVMRCRAAIKKIAISGRFDVVHAHGRIPALVCESLTKKDAFPPFAVTAHGMYDPAPPRKTLSCWGDRTVAVSEDVKEYLVNEYGLSPDRIDVITNGISLDTPERRKSDRLRIVTASRLDSDTSLTATMLCRMMPRICKEHPQLSPLLTVYGSGEKLDEVRAIAKISNEICPGCIKIKGSVTDMRTALADADIFVGSSRAALEAMASSLPVVLSSNFGCDGVVDETNLRRAENTNFTCRGGEPTSLERLRGEVERLISASESERDSLGKFGRIYVSKRCSAEIFADKTIEFYKKLIAESRGGIMLCGYFGAGNAGDNATLSAVLRMLPPLKDGQKPTVPTRSGGALPRDVEGINRLNIIAISKKLAKTRLFILCGGTLLQNSTSNRSLGYYYSLAKLAHKKGARVMIWAGGVGPLIGEEAEYRALHTVETADVVTLRDPSSISLLEEYEFDTSGIRLSADAALLTEPLPLPEGIVLDENERYFAVSVRSLRGLKRGEGALDESEMFENIKRAVRDISTNYGMTPLWLPLATEDEALCRSLCAKTARGRVIPKLSPGRIVKLISKCEFVLGMRLHSAVFASAAGVPAIMISYDPKVRAFAEYAHHPDCLDPYEERHLSRSLVLAAGELYSEMDEAKYRVQSRAIELSALSLGDASLAEALYWGDPTENK